MTHMIRSPSFNSALDYWMQTFNEHPPNSSDHPTLHNHIDDDISCPDISYATHHLPLSHDQLASTNTPSATKSKVINQVSHEDEKHKPISRRSRSRACKKSTPTKHLNATAKNFKDLVQQYTGCPPAFALIGGSGKLKGPVTLNFGQGRLSSYDQEQGQNYIIALRDSTFMGSSRVSSTTSYVHGIRDQLKRRDNQGEKD
ncbi:hypothetical protein QQ045_022689 [Rhodiola kirilowii]